MSDNYLENESLVLRKRSSPSAYLQHQRYLLMHVGLGFILLALIVAVIYAYVTHEHTIYVSDYVGYQNITHSIVAQLRHSPVSALLAIARSMAGEYNAIFTIPLIPWMLALGESRITYEIALGVVYLLPFSLALGALAVELIRARPPMVFWSTVLLALLTPPVWVPTLRGYPDTGAAVMLALAIWIYLRDTRLQRPWQMIAIGFFATSAILFRRHFAYAALAFFGAIALQALIKFAMDARSEPKLAWRRLRTSILRLGLIAFVASAVLITFGRPFLIRFLTIDYNALYSGYTKPPLSSLGWYVASYGWLVIGAAVLGFLLGIRNRIVNRDAAIFLVLFGGFTLIAWLWLARQTGEQYTLNFTPGVVLGLSMLLWNAVLRFKPIVRQIALIGGSICLTANLILSLTTVTVRNYSNISSLFAMQEAPFIRGDQAQVMRLVNYLRNIAGNGEPIYVAASSSIMGKDTLVSAEHIFYGWDHTRLNILYSPEIDSRDYYPLELLLRAQYVLVVDPFQYHLSPERQRIVQVVYDIFKNNREFAQDFVELPDHFTLDEGAIVSVYRRVHPTSIPMAVQTFEFMQSFVQARPGGQLDWMLLDQTEISTVTSNHDRTYLVSAHLAAQERPSSTTLLYIGPSAESGVLRGQISFLAPRCAGVIVRLAYVTAPGKIKILDEMIRQPGDSPNFALTFEKPDAGFLLLMLESIGNQKTAEICPLNINHLRFAGE